MVQYKSFEMKFLVFLKFVKTKLFNFTIRTAIYIYIICFKNDESQFQHKLMVYYI